MLLHCDPFLDLSISELFLYDYVSIRLILSLVVSQMLNVDLSPIVQKLTIDEGSRAKFVFPGTLSELFESAAEAFHVGLESLAQLVVLVHFISLPLLKRHQLLQIRAGNDIEAFAELVMDHHGQGTFDKAVSLEHTVLETSHLNHLVVQMLQLLLKCAQC